MDFITLKQKLKKFLPYIVLLYLSIWQAYSLLKVEDNINLQLLAAVSTFAFYLILILINEKLFKIIFFPILLLSIFIYPTLKVYGYPDVNFISNTLYSNPGESLSYIKVLPTKIFVKILLLIAIGVYLLITRYPKIEKYRLPLIIISILIIIIPTCYNLIFPTKEKFKDKEKLIAQFNYTTIPFIKIPVILKIGFDRVVKTNKEIMDKAKRPDIWEIIDKEKAELSNTFVIVIGESVRKDFMHCYGFPEENTPFIEQSNRIQFDNLISAGAFTVPSLTKTIVLSNPFPYYNLPNNIVNLSKKLGYETYWVSNQGYIGIYDSPISILGKNCDHSYMLNNGDFHIVKTDVEMLPIYKKIVKTKTDKPKIIFLHTIGSHPHICDRTGGEYDNFILSEYISCYNQSIKNADLFLKEVHEELVKTKKDYNMIYFSDHGLQITWDKDVTHGKEVKEAHQVPLFLWSDKITQTKHINATRNSKDFLSLFCEINNITTKNIKTHYLFLSEEDAGEDVYKVVVAEEEVFDWRKFKSDPIPLQNKSAK